MRSVTRNAAAVVVAALLVLLALGAVPSLLGTGDPHYLEATAVNGSGVGGTTASAVPAGIEPANASTLFEESYPYTFGAIDAAGNASGRSDPYRTGPLGLKGAFTHSPFDEMRAYGAQYPDATTGDAAFVRRGNATYRLEVIQP